MYAQFIFLPKPGLQSINQVHLNTRWRSVVPHPYKSILCPLPSNDIIQLALKKGRKKETNNTDTVTNTTTDSQQGKKSARPTTPKSKKHETRIIVVEGEKVDADPEEVQSDDEDSGYVDNDYNPDPIRILEEQIATTRPIRGKIFPQKKPEAPVTKDKKVERLNQVSELKEKEKKQQKEVLQKRITTRNMKQLEREKKEPPDSEVIEILNHHTIILSVD